ncbi:MAG: DNA-binding domain-containing protein, partial [Pseudomonadota bacterium]|nr:DNA-binding domain-containing protein [Pseudomonadota bacterium]
MSELLSLQQAFQQSLLNTDQCVIDELVGTKNAPAAERLGVYQEAYRLRLIEALGDNYRGLEALLGEEVFENLCGCYIDAHPSRHYSIRWYGDRLAAWLKETEPWRKQGVLAEMAAWEWSLSLAFDAPEAETVGEETAESIPPEAWPVLTFRFHPSLQRVDLAWSVPRFRQQVEEEDEEIGPPEQAEQPLPWLIWRTGLRQKFRSMEVNEAWALDTARQGENFAAICEGLCEWVDPQHAALRAAGFLKGWFQDGLITSVETSP